MDRKYRIVIDTLGADAGPLEVLKGANMILEQHPEVVLTIVGDKATIEENMTSLDRVEIIDTDVYFSNDENIMEALAKKPNASILLAAKACKEKEDCIGLLTAGNSGSVLVSCVKYLLTPEMTRPCIAGILPNEKDFYTCLVDCGANIDCTASQLHQFARLGRDFMQNLYGLESPKIGLLSNGVESHKGNKLVKETYPILKEDKTLNFVGNIEGNRALSGDCDVLVADGFAANQVLKVTEGTATRMIKDMVKYSQKHQQPEIMELVNYLMMTYDLSALGGGVVLGVSKPVIKSRGNSKAITFFNTADMLINIANNKTIFNNRDVRLANDRN